MRRYVEFEKMVEMGKYHTYWRLEKPMLLTMPKKRFFTAKFIYQQSTPLYRYGSFAISDNANKIGKIIFPRSSPPTAKGRGARTPPTKIAPKNGA